VQCNLCLTSGDPGYLTTTNGILIEKPHLAYCNVCQWRTGSKKSNYRRKEAFQTCRFKRLPRILPGHNGKQINSHWRHSAKIDNYFTVSKTQNHLCCETEKLLRKTHEAEWVTADNEDDICWRRRRRKTEHIVDSIVLCINITVTLWLKWWAENPIPQFHRLHFWHFTERREIEFTKLIV